MTTPGNGGAGRLLLRSVRVDNYKCLSDFELSFGAMTLLLGKNGCGKTAVFEAINALHRATLPAAPIGSLFPASTLTRWGGNNEQAFELRVGGNGGGEEYRYRLTVEHKPEQVRLKEESLTLNEKPVFEVSGGTMNLYDESHNLLFPMPFDSVLPGLSVAGKNNKMPRAQKFHEWLNGVTMLSLFPGRMHSISDDAAQYPDADGGNFASWYRWIVRDDESAMAAADKELARALPGYQKLKLDKVGKKDKRELLAVFQSEGGEELEYAFDELSLGQRALIALYCFMHGGDRNRLLLIDEPDNFVTLPEVQPLLMELDLGAGDELPQIAMISHHPEAVSFISDKETVWMAREPEQPARIVEFENDTKIHTAKLYALGLAP